MQHPIKKGGWKKKPQWNGTWLPNSKLLSLRRQNDQSKGYSCCKNLKMHVPRNWYVMPQGTQYAAAAFVSTRFRDQILEAWMIGERSILDDFLAKNDLVQWLGCWSLQPLAIIMFLDESWRHSNGFGIIAADGHLGFDFQVHDCM